MKTTPPDMSEFHTDAEELEARRRFTVQAGYRFCSIPACNCDSWHGGHAADRLAEIADTLQSSGFGSYTDENGNLHGFSIQNAIERLIKAAAQTNPTTPGGQL